MNGKSVGGTSEGGGESSQGLRKGPWTAIEDEILLDYIKKHGEGNWNAVQKNTRLIRCGKSCRLRWVNHLKPNLKKGCFSPEEERNIIELHSKFGNKWARIASQLSGRTDNEIKNYWNTKVKRRQRAGLPVYPQDIQQPQQQQNQHFVLQNHQNSASSSSFSFADPISFSISTNPLQTSFHSNPTIQFNGAFAMPISPASPTLFNQNLYTQSPNPSHQFNSSNFDPSYSFNSKILATPIGQSGGNHQAMKPELASIQTPPHTRSSTSSGCSRNGGDDYVIISPFSRGNSGLLDDLVQESSTLFGKKNSIGENSSAGLNPLDDFSSSQSSISIKHSEERIDQTNTIDDDLMSFLNNSDDPPEFRV